MSEEIDDFFRTEVTNHTTLSSCHSFTNSLADPVLYKTMKTPLKNHTVTVVSGLERSFFFSGGLLHVSAANSTRSLYNAWCTGT